jgi:hypothetical protein
MTKTQKNIAEKMFNDCYMMQRLNHSKRLMFMLYEGNANPVKYVSPSTFKHFWDMNVLKKDKLGRFTFNLSIIRQMHGKTVLKTMYNKRK